MKTHKFGWKPDLPDMRDHLMTLEVTHLPPAVDLRPQCPPVVDQGQLGSCTANAIAAALLFDEMKQGEANPQPKSRLFIYFNERAIEHTTSSDAGAMIRDGIKSVAKQGACPETAWPYDVTRFAFRPTPKAYTLAKQYEALTYKKVAKTATQLKACLAQGIPVVFGITVYSSFMSDAVASTGDVPMPQVHETVEGGHAILMVGYDSEKGVFRFRNSWGTSWGDQGYGTLPEAYVLSNLASDFWAIQTVGAGK